MAIRHATTFFATIALTVAGCGAAASPGPSASPSTVTAPAASTAGAQGRSADPPPSDGPAVVTGLALQADPAEWVGTCPVDITFSATVTVAGRGAVSYRWRSSDGDVSPIKTLSFAGSGSQSVTSSWTVDPTSLPTHAGWSSIEIVEPAPGPSSPPVTPARFAFTCPDDDDIEAIGFGIGGSDADCSIARPSDTFAPTDRIRMVANWWPSLPAGTVVTARLTQAGNLVDGYPVTIHFDVATKCVHGNVSNGYLAVGHYRLDLEPDRARAVGAEFDVR